jgi:hypothetical protein
MSTDVGWYARVLWSGTDAGYQSPRGSTEVLLEEAAPSIRPLLGGVEIGTHVPETRYHASGLAKPTRAKNRDRIGLSATGNNEALTLQSAGADLASIPGAASRRRPIWRTTDLETRRTLALDRGRRGRPTHQTSSLF